LVIRLPQWRALVIAANVFEQVGNKCSMVLRQGSPVMQPPGDEPPRQRASQVRKTFS
jgi:hypothetical protein